MSKMWLQLKRSMTFGHFRPTFLMSEKPRKPQPQDRVLKISTGVYWRFVKD